MPYRYAGLEPVPDGKGGIVRPGEIRDRAPAEFGPWDEIPGDAPEEPQDAPPAPPPPAPSPAPAAPSQPATPPAAGNGGN